MILVEEGQGPILLCLPHSGTDVPKMVLGRFNATGRLQADLAWRLEQVFGLRDQVDVTLVRSTTSRYVIDLDKAANSQTLPEAAQDEPPCPTSTLDGKAIYQEGEEPGPVETEQRCLLFHDPFHLALRRQIDRLLKLHNQVVVLDCQSVRSSIQGFTDKGLPLVNIGSAEGQSCDPDLRNLLVGSFKGEPGITVGVDEHTKGGFITRTYGRPDLGVHCLTLLLAQRSYLRHESPPFEPDKSRVTRLKTILSDGLSRLVDWTEMNTDKARPPVESETAEEDALTDAEAPGPDAENTEAETETAATDDVNEKEPVQGAEEDDADGTLPEQAESEEAQDMEAADEAPSTDSDDARAEPDEKEDGKPMLVAE